MKFTKSHYKQFLDRIEKLEFTSSEFSFTKRKGRVIIHKNDSIFSYFSRKHSNDFEVVVGRQIRIVLSFDEVLELFEGWIRSFESPSSVS